MYDPKSLKAEEFIDHQEILDTLGYIRLAINNNDEEAFKRIINTPARGIGDTTVGKILETAHKNDVSCWTVLSDPMTYALPVNAGTLAKLAEFKKLMDSLVAAKEEKDAYEFVEMVVHNSGMWTARAGSATTRRFSTNWTATGTSKSRWGASTGSRTAIPRDVSSARTSFRRKETSAASRVRRVR